MDRVLSFLGVWTQQKALTDGRRMSDVYFVYYPRVYNRIQ